MSRWLAPNWSDWACVGSIWKVYEPSDTPTSARWAPVGTNGDVRNADRDFGCAALGDVASPEQPARRRLAVATVVSSGTSDTRERAIIGNRIRNLSSHEGSLKGGNNTLGTPALAMPGPRDEPAYTCQTVLAGTASRPRSAMLSTRIRLADRP